MTYRQAHRHEAEARSLGVSKVARSARGFMRAYERASLKHKGRPRKIMQAMAAAKVPGFARQNWAQRRDAFVARWLPAYRKAPSRRKALALAMWACRVPAL
jgi:hypothetical protein